MVFDFIKVKAIGVTQPLVDFIPNSEGIISYAARVSAPQNQTNFDTADKLLGYCAKNSHWSVFETCSITMEIEAPRDICRQILRHRSFSFQEFCIAGDSLITTLTKCGRSSKVSIESLYKRYLSKQYWNSSDNLVRVFDEESKTLVPAKIKEVFETGVKPCYKITLENGKSIVATGEHKFLVAGGTFKRLSDITTEDFVGCNGVPVWQDKEWLSNAKKESLSHGGVQYIAEKAGVSYHTIRKWLKVHGLQFSKAEVSSYTEAWNKGLSSECQPRYGKPVSEVTRNKHRASARRGIDSNLYINGNKSSDTLDFQFKCRQWSSAYKMELLEKQNYTCPETGKKLCMNTADVDHRLPVYSHPELAYDKGNIRAVCKEFHKQKSIGESVQCRKTARYCKVKSIEFVGDVQTYDMEIEHSSHNYVANGIITHNSQRYAEAAKFCYRDARLQDEKNRQNSFETDDEELKSWWNEEQEWLVGHISRLYEDAIAKGIAKECARVLLPEGLTMSKMYMQGSVRSWMHHINLRKENGTQLEHCDVAWKSREEFVKLFPSLEKYV